MYEETYDSEVDQGKNLWSTLLQEVKEKNAKSQSNPTTLLVLGDQLTGKSSLIGRLQKSDTKNGVALEFDYIDVKDESLDESKILNVWVASNDTYQNNLMKYALNENNFEVTMCLVFISYSEPWDLIQSAEDWLNIIKNHSERLKIDPQKMNFYKESILHQFREYTEPELPGETEVVVGGKRRDLGINHLHPQIVEDPEKVIVPLESGVFDVNFGLPIMIIVTKTDFMHNLQQEFDYNEDKFDFIQLNLRKLCLKYGAGLCFTSLKDDKNCNLLYKYITHRCYGFSFYETASILEKDTIFIPAGWDSIQKIKILEDNLPDELKDQPYSAIVSKPLSLIKASTQSRLTEPEMAEDEQMFLMKQQVLIQKDKMENASGKPDAVRGKGAPLTKGGSMAGGPAGRGRKGMPVQNSMAMGANAAGQGNEGVLANFFNSLLHKKGVPGAALPNQSSNASDSSKEELMDESCSKSEDFVQQSENNNDTDVATEKSATTIPGKVKKDEVDKIVERDLPAVVEYESEKEENMSKNSKVGVDSLEPQKKLEPVTQDKAATNEQKIKDDVQSKEVEYEEQKELEDVTRDKMEINDQEVKEKMQSEVVDNEQQDKVETNEQEIKEEMQPETVDNEQQDKVETNEQEIKEEMQPETVDNEQQDKVETNKQEIKEEKQPETADNEQQDKIETNEQEIKEEMQPETVDNEQQDKAETNEQEIKEDVQSEKVEYEQQKELEDITQDKVEVNEEVKEMQSETVDNEQQDKVETNEHDSNVRPMEEVNDNVHPEQKENNNTNYEKENIEEAEIKIEKSEPQTEDCNNKQNEANLTEDEKMPVNDDNDDNKTKENKEANEALVINKKDTDAINAEDKINDEVNNTTETEKNISTDISTQGKIDSSNSVDLVTKDDATDEIKDENNIDNNDAKDCNELILNTTESTGVEPET